MTRSTRATVTGLAAAALAIGCASSQTIPSDAQAQLEAKQQELATLEQTVRERDQALEKSRSELQELQNRLETKNASVSAAPPTLASGGDLLPPAAKPGECYARAFVPPRYETKTVSMLKRSASERLEIQPARYQMAEERVLVKEATEKLEVVPATYATVEERVLVQEATTRLEEVPAVYAMEQERVLVKAAHTTWKKGRGPIEKINDATGEIMCLVEVPAEYKTVQKRVLKSAATTRTIEIPAKYQTLEKRVVKTPATTRTVAIPAQYKTVKVRKLAEPAREKRIEIPAEYQSVNQREQVAEGRLEWRPVLCETNASAGTVSAIQRALDAAGHDPGPIDGQLGRQTLTAVKSYQQSKGLATGGLTYATIDSLGVKVGR